jgi:branched-chain amino acid transport system permease protein
VERLLSFGLPGISYGCTYAIMALGLVLTYQATGVFNFAYGAQAYASAFLYAWLVEVHHLPVWLGFVLAVVVMGPVLALAFDRFLFSHISPTNNVAKLVTGIAIAVALPVIVPFVFGYKSNIYNVPAVGFHSNRVYLRLAGTPVTGWDLSALCFTAAVLVALVILMRFTALGLRMRAAVESRRMVELEGINASWVVSSAWMVSGLMAGLAGVVLASYQAQLQAESYVTLMVAGIAAAAVAAMRWMTRAVWVSIVMGVISLVAQGYLPTSSVFYSAVLPSLPFIVLAIALLVVPEMSTLEDSSDPLASVDPPPPPSVTELRAPQLDRVIKVGWYGLLTLFVLSMLTWLPRADVSYMDEGLALSIILLSITLVTGMGGQLSLCQATLAGVGAFTAALAAEHLHLSFFVGGALGMVSAAAVAVVVALLSARLRGLGLSLMTLAAAIVFDTAIFSQQAVSGSVGGVQVQPGWYGGVDIANPNGRELFILAMIALVLCVAVVLLLRRGTTGLFLAAMRGSEVAAEGIGINVTMQRVVVFAISGAIAGLGGTIYATAQSVVSPTSFDYQFGLAFVVVVVTTGAAKVEGAIQGGIGFVVVQQLLALLPQRFQGLTIVLFAFGALTYAKHPEGIVEFQKRRWTQRFERILFRSVNIQTANIQRVDTQTVGSSSVAVSPSVAAPSSMAAPSLARVDARSDWPPPLQPLPAPPPQAPGHPA